MEQVWSTLAWVFASAAAGAILARWLKVRGKYPSERLLSVSGSLVVWVLIFLMGYGLGRDESLVARIPELGLAALVIAVLATACSAILSMLFFGREKAEEGSQGQTSRLKLLLSYLKDPAFLLSSLAAGILMGCLLRLLPGTSPPDAGILPSLTLYLLLFLSGMGLAGQDPKELKSAFTLKSAFLPLVTVLGSLLGGLLAALLLKLEPMHGIAASAGFGWYSLSGILITELGLPFLGAVAFLSNLFRESIAIIFIPILARFGWKHASISISGSPSMDVTLPLIVKYSGYPWMGPSLFHGTVLSLLTPVIVPLFLP